MNKIYLIFPVIALTLCTPADAAQGTELCASSCRAITACCMPSSPYKNMSCSELEKEKSNLSCCLDEKVNDALLPALICWPMISSLLCCPLPADEAFLGAGGIATTVTLLTKFGVIDQIFKHEQTEIDALLKEKQS